MFNIDDLTKLVIKGYSKTEVLQKYSKIGLWKAEEILIKKYFPPKSSVLDIGIGAGRTTIPLYNMDFKVTGIDLSKSMINTASQLSNFYQAKPELYSMDVRKLTFRDNCFDGVLFSFNGLEHVPRIKGKLEAIRQINRVIKPNCYWIFTVHSGLPFNSLWYNWLKYCFKFCLKRIRKRNNNEIEFGERFFNRAIPEGVYTHIISTYKLEKLLKDCNFEIVEFNTEKNIERSKKKTIFSRFRTGNLFYCVKKCI